ncbi:kinase-like domain-containing protein [Boeremia exigua]|uniref:kinase-like domain-containing protein n=1 Tax=Boeremia exigua TaxID=749465 RepID=UPI001E8E3BC2|nr:kinase-like domain-containing protein [Boeremia exigua]KAH6638729.1 kinase-like domain-containing protein [Boeremia exigua]
MSNQAVIGERLSREELFKYTNGRFLVREKESCDQRYLEFDLDQLCAVAASVSSNKSPVRTIEKLEGGFSKALIMSKEDGTEVVAKLPFSIAGPSRYLTASEAAVLQYLHNHTPVPVPKVLAWNADSSNPVGAEYIIMEKAAGCQLVKKWGEMEDLSHFEFIKNLCKIEADLAAIAFPANGSLYLRESMRAGDKYKPLAPEIDPSGSFCIRTSCERSWFGKDEAESIQARFDRGPWPTLPAFGIALVNREIARIEQNPKVVLYGPPQGSVEEQISTLNTAKEVFLKMDTDTLPGRLPWPTLWYTDLHMGNIYVSEKEPTQIVSIIDWQSIVISPLFYQVRFPELITIGEDYELGPEIPTLPENIDEMDDDDQAVLRFKHKQAMKGKAYEAASGFKNKNVFKSIRLPPLSRQLFLRCGEAWEEGIVPLRVCLIAIADVWKEAGFTGDCPYEFSKGEIERYQHEFQKYRDHHKICELAREYLGTDTDGWIAPDDDFNEKQQRNKELLDICMAHCAEYGKSTEEMRKIWPYL